MMKTLNSVMISIALIVSVIILGMSYTYKYRLQNTVAVTGLGETEFTSDRIVWRGYITAESQNPAAGYSQLEQSKKKVIDFITSHGVAESALTFMFVDVRKESQSIYSSDGRYSGERFTGYLLRQEFVVESDNVDAVEVISREISSLIAQGVQMDLWQPSYYYSKLDDIKLSLIELATLDARERAERITNKAEGKLGKLKNARTGVFQITGANADEEFSAGGNLNTSSRHKKARITVRLEYRVK